MKHPKLTLVTADELAKRSECTKFFQPRGLDPAALGYGYITRADLRTVLGLDTGTGAISIPYYTETGEPLIDEGLGDHFIRYRLTPYKSPKGKYRSVQGSYSHAYLTPGIDWAEVGADPSIPLMFTEGEFKAAKVNSAAGWPCCVAFSGVWNWRGRRMNLPMVPELVRWVWRNRRVIICYDADSSSKEAVSLAMSHLAGLMQAHDAVVSIVHLNKITKVKGVDDYIVGGGSWPELEATATEGEPSEVAKMLATYGLLISQEKVINLHTGETHGRTFFHDSIAFNNRIEVVEGDKVKSVPVSKIWVGHKARVDVAKFDLNPEYGWGLQPGEGHATWFNTWRGFKHAPEKNDGYDDVVERWTTFCDGLLGKANAKLFHRWVAWVYKRPWDRNYTSWVIKSRDESIGKSLLAETVARMLGCNTGDPARILGPDGLFSDYPDYAEGTVLLVCNEVSSDQARHVRMMKALRTNDSLEVNKKYGAKYMVPNYLNLIITTNDDYAYGMSREARRDIVVECEFGGDSKQDWKAWVRDEVVPLSTEAWGLKALAWFYAREVDLKGYDPKADAPYSEAKEKMAAASEGGLAVYREKAEEVVGAWDGYGVVPSARLRAYLQRDESINLRSDGAWMAFVRVLEAVAGYKGLSYPVKVSGKLETCVFFGKNKKQVDAFDKQAEIARSLELLGKGLKY